MRQCMDSDNLHRRLKKIIGQVQAIDRMIDEDIPCEEILSQINVSGTASNMVTQIRPLKALQRQWSALPTCNDVSAQRLKIQRNLTSYTNIQSQSIQGWLFLYAKKSLTLWILL